MTNCAMFESLDEIKDLYAHVLIAIRVNIKCFIVTFLCNVLS